MKLYDDVGIDSNWCFVRTFPLSSGLASSVGKGSYANMYSLWSVAKMSPQSTTTNSNNGQLVYHYNIPHSFESAGE